jgi:creatinine amidohydrolase
MAGTKGRYVRRFEEMTWKEVADAIEVDTLFVLPLGSIEQHGPHLPLGTDAFIPYELANRIGDRRPFILAPPIMYTTYSRPRSGGGRTFVGSTGVPDRTFGDLLSHVVSDLLRQGFRRLFVLNGHFENASTAFETLQEAIEPKRETHKAVLINWWELLGPHDIDEIYGDAFPGWEAEHASLLETALMEAVAPALVHDELKQEGGAARTLRYDVFPTPPETIFPTGIGWTAKTASRQLGETVAALLVDRLCAILDEEFGPAL